jgi:hypothetical protein
MNWDMRGLSSAVDAFGAFVPSLLAGLVILLLGYIVASVLARVTRALLARVGFDRLTQRLGLSAESADRERDPHRASRWAGKAVFLTVILGTIMQVARTWNMTFVAAGLARLIAYIPHILGAGVILAASILVGNWVRDRILRSRLLSAGEVGLREEHARILPSLVRGGILTIGIFMALQELQIAPEIVNVAFSLLLGAIALATAIAFGLGGREVAGRIAQNWYDRRADLRRDVIRTSVPSDVGHDMEFPQRSDMPVPSRP